MTDRELDAVPAAARAISPSPRASFLALLGRELENSADFGEGVVDRAIATNAAQSLRAWVPAQYALSDRL
jgi:hypothetical protein